MTCNGKDPLHTTAAGPMLLLLAIFFPGGHSSPDVPFPLVFVQNLPDLQIEWIITLPQPLGQCFVDRGFGNAELLCCRADSGTGFNHVHSQFTGAFFQG